MAATTFSIALLLGATSPVGAVTLSPGDDQVTGEDKLWVRHDGGTDQAISLCNDDSTTEAAGDDGGSRRQANEPYSVVDPTDPDTIIAGWNDYCLADLGMGWQGFGYSRDGGQSWFNSFVPGYPLDTSTEGQDSPLFGVQAFAGDPIAAFDSQGNLFVGGISFNRAGAINGHVYVATYTNDDVPIPGADAYPVNYSHTRVVGRGTPSRNFFGIFQDKPMLEVDRTGGEHDGNVYVCWSRFTGFGQNKIYFSRSTDSGETFSRPIALTQHGKVGSVQGCDIAVEADGDVYVTFRTFNDPAAHTGNALAFARSTDGGASFSRARKILNFIPYAPADPTRDCGDGPFHCPADFVFHRVPLEPRVTADQAGVLDGVFVVYNAVDPTTIVASQTSYSSAGRGRVGQSLVYVVSSTSDGASWSLPVAVNPGAGPMQTGHQFFPDFDALSGQLAIVWQDNRNDPAKSVQFPLGNTHDADGNGISTGTMVVDSFLATSTDGTAWSTVQVSDRAHQSQYEMFGDRNLPFHGDYNWISLAPDGAGGLVGYMTWADNRDVVEGGDPREAFDDGFDVTQCRAQDAEGNWGPDTCANAGGLDQNIYGRGVTFP